MKKRKGAIVQMFRDGEDLPLFSGTPARAILRPFVPEETAARACLPGFELSACDDKFAATRRPLTDQAKEQG